MSEFEYLIHDGAAVCEVLDAFAPDDYQRIVTLKGKRLKITYHAMLAEGTLLVRGTDDFEEDDDECDD